MTSPQSINERHVIVSGGSRGLGKAIVQSLLDEDYLVSTFSRCSTAFVEGIEHNKKFFFAPADISDENSVSHFLKCAESSFGRPYGLINCAAMATDGLLATMPEDSIKKILAVNAEGTLRLTRLVVRRMLSGRN